MLPAVMQLRERAGGNSDTLYTFGNGRRILMVVSMML
jgi:hypothetical protein